MNNKIVIIYQFTLFYQIIKEIEHHLNFDVIEALNNNELNDAIKGTDNYLIVTNKTNLAYSNQFILDKVPIKIFEIIEKLNISFLKALV